VKHPSIVAIALSLAACSSTASGPFNDNFDGTRFTNPGFTKESSVAGYLRLRMTTSQPEWPAHVPVAATPQPAARVDGDEIHVTMIGHATLLLQTRGMNVLTDPMWSERASPLSFAGPKRITPPAIELAQLPRIDLVLISHNHWDHLDLPTLRALDAAFRPRVIVPLGNRAMVAAVMPASEVSEHDWGEVVEAGALRVHVLPMLHGSGRTPFDQQRTLWAAYLLDGGATRAYFVGDAGYGRGINYKAAAATLGPIDVALLPIGAYEPAWFMADSHMRPSEAVQALLDSGARQGVAHHFDTFQLGFEAYGAAATELYQALSAAGQPRDRMVALRAGQSLVVRPVGASSAAR
jgi:L-ascorbate metabolism protein UlaG (beta-lactamase superfamily)